MPLYIAGKPMTDINQIIQAVQRLPEPTVIDNIDAPFDMTKAVLSLQREATYVNTADPNNRFSFMGSLGVYNCLFLYLHNKTEHLGIHLDGALPSDFTSLLRPFKDSKSLEAVLVGGCENHFSSKPTLENSLKALLRTTETLKIDITIKCQKILSANQFDPKTDTYRSVHNIFCQRLAAFNRRYFANQLNMDTIFNYPIARLRDVRMADILPTRLTATAAAPKTITTLALCLSAIGEVSTFTDAKAQDASAEALTNFLVLFEATLGKNILIPYIFSRDFHDAFIKARKDHLPFQPVKMYDFAVELKTGTFHRISANTPLPYAGLRRLWPFSSNNTTDYHLVYDGCGWYKKPPLSPEFFNTLNKLEEIFSQNKVINHQDIYKILKIPDRYPEKETLINNIAQWTHLWIQEKKQEKKEKNISLLKEATGLFFLDKTWEGSSSADAIGFADDPKSLVAAHHQLTKSGLSACFLKSPKNRYLLFIPTIDEGQQSEIISALPVTQPPLHQ